VNFTISAVVPIGHVFIINEIAVVVSELIFYSSSFTRRRLPVVTNYRSGPLWRR